MLPNLVMIRHGQSVFNSQNRFAGWVDTDLTTEGERQAKAAGETIVKTGFTPDIIYISPLTRTKRTAQIMFGQAGFIEDARLVERFYGDLSGKNKEETLKQVGDDMFLQIRRGYETSPPAIQADNKELASVNETFNRLIKGTFTNVLPPTESLKDVEVRVRPFYDSVLTPALKSGKKVMVVAHGNSLRALIKIIKQIDAAGIAKVELETAQPAGFMVDISGATLKVTSDSLGKHFTEVF